jgi:hypothetical protein
MTSCERTPLSFNVVDSNSSQSEYSLGNLTLNDFVNTVAIAPRANRPWLRFLSIYPYDLNKK